MKKILAILLLATVLHSCFKEDEPVTAHKGESIVMDQSLYTYQSFFDLETRQVVAFNAVDAWDLGFESSDTGWHIIINSGKYLGIYNTGMTDFDGITSVPSSSVWKFDKSDGNPDSTAIGEWLSPRTGLSYNKVYVTGVYDGVKYLPLKKIVFTSLSRGVYSFRYSNLDGTDPATFAITRDPSANFSYFSFANGGRQVLIEPEKSSWDLEFTQYMTTLYTDQGVPTPYFVRGVLINRNGVEVALDSLAGYSNITFADIPKQQFSRNSDAIGYDWKSVSITGTSADYDIRQNYTYIIRNNKGSYYKIRFTGYYNDFGSPGYPRFEMRALF